MADETEDSDKPDLRYSAIERQGIRIDRSLDASGHLARGDKTKMSVVNFSSRHQARTERDPDFEFRPAAVKPASPAEPAVPAPAAERPAVEVPKSVLAKFKGLFGF